MEKLKQVKHFADLVALFTEETDTQRLIKELFVYTTGCNDYLFNGTGNRFIIENKIIPGFKSMIFAGLENNLSHIFAIQFSEFDSPDMIEDLIKKKFVCKNITDQKSRDNIYSANFVSQNQKTKIELLILSRHNLYNDQDLDIINCGLETVSLLIK